MTEQKVYYSVASIAHEVGRTRRAVQFRLRCKDIEPDAILVLPAGRRVALFSEDRMENLRMLMTEPKTKL